MSGRPPEEAGHPNPDDAYDNVGTHVTSGTGQPGLLHKRAAPWTAHYIQRRQAVLGCRFFVHDDVDLAADDVTEHLGSNAKARRWALQLVAALDRKRGAA